MKTNKKVNKRRYFILPGTDWRNEYIKYAFYDTDGTASHSERVIYVFDVDQPVNNSIRRFQGANDAIERYKWIEISEAEVALL